MTQGSGCCLISREKNEPLPPVLLVDFALQSVGELHTWQRRQKAGMATEAESRHGVLHSAPFVLIPFLWGWNRSLDCST